MMCVVLSEGVHVLNTGHNLALGTVIATIGMLSHTWALINEPQYN
jgi:hypothetical protein